jgi:hypothetical protein
MAVNFISTIKYQPTPSGIYVIARKDILNKISLNGEDFINEVKNIEKTIRKYYTIEEVDFIALSIKGEMKDYPYGFIINKEGLSLEDIFDTFNEKEQKEYEYIFLHFLKEAGT